ncbi:MAG: CPBP family intramembrane metalloprotease [Nitrospiraceae bacterium]|nr:MAG: CPBP family intramembrane metalloprotease [Nitrospiraceae bacterium]
MGRTRLLIIAVLAEGAVLALAVLLARYFDRSLFPLSGNYPRDVSLGIAGALPLFILFRFTLSEKARDLPLFRSLRSTVIHDIGHLFARAGLIDLFVISLLAGFAEELFFRGIVQVRFGIAAGSILFGLFHFITPAYVIVTVLVGFYFGLIYHVLGAILVPVVAHGLYDFAALMYLRHCISTETGEGCNDEMDMV